MAPPVCVQTLNALWRPTPSPASDFANPSITHKTAAYRRLSNKEQLNQRLFPDTQTGNSLARIFMIISWAIPRRYYTGSAPKSHQLILPRKLS